MNMNTFKNKNYLTPVHFILLATDVRLLILVLIQFSLQGIGLAISLLLLHVELRGRRKGSLTQ